MDHNSSFQRWRWEQNGGFGDDSYEPRNTTMTLAEELALCGEDLPFVEGFSSNSKSAPARPEGLIPSDPDKRRKARLGKRFSHTVRGNTEVGKDNNCGNGDSNGIGQQSSSTSSTAQLEQRKSNWEDPELTPGTEHDRNI